MNHRADVGVREEIHVVVFAGLDVDLDFGKARDIGERLAVARIVVLRGSHQALARDRRDGRLGQFVQVRRRFVTVVDAAELDRALSRLRQCHAAAVALAEDALARDLVVLGSAAETLRCDLLQLLPRIHRGGVSGARHRVGRLAAAGYAGERKVVGAVAPDDIALFPWHTENFRTRAMHIDNRLSSQVADSGLEGDAPVRLYDEKPIEADRAADETTERDADAAHLRADPFRSSRHSVLPFELLGAAIEGLLEKRAGRMQPRSISINRCAEWRLAFGTVDASDRYLVQSEFARGFRDDRFDDRDALQPAR